MSHLSVHTHTHTQKERKKEVDGFVKPALLRPKTSTTSESPIDE
jgi:hypothetical protein